MNLEGTIVNGRVELDAPVDLPDGTRVRVEPATASRADDEPSIEQRFEELARQWKKGTAYSSSAADIATHPAYQQIIGMGRDVLPYIFQELRRKPDHWFWALNAITGENPVPQTARGELNKMTDAWL